MLAVERLRCAATLLLWAALVLSVALVPGCTTSETPATSTPDDKNAVIALLVNDCTDPVNDVYAASQAAAGAISACAYERELTVDELRSHFPADGFPDPGIGSSAHKLRIAYGSERSDGSPTQTSAAIYIPSSRRADPSPVVVLGHGSVGLADECAPSREEPGGFDKDWKALAYTFAGDGWVVIMPDFPGLGTNGVTSWMHSDDEGHAMLDATRAMRNLFREGALSDKNAIIGHSNGAHAALSAQSYAAAYGSAGSIDTVVVFSPFWLSNAAWGALITSLGEALITPTFMSLTMQYFYGHLAAYEGEDHKLDAFLEDKALLAGDMLEAGCWQDITREEHGPPSIGVNRGADLFRQSYIDEVGACALNQGCDSELAATWKARWVADRPPADTTIPIVQWTGALDDFLTPGFQQCGADRLAAQGADLTICVAAEGEHSTLVSGTADWVRQHLAATLLGQAPPDTCPGVEVLAQPPACSLPIPNSVDPSEP